MLIQLWGRVPTNFSIVEAFNDPQSRKFQDMALMDYEMMNYFLIQSTFLKFNQHLAQLLMHTYRLLKILLQIIFIITEEQILTIAPPKFLIDTLTIIILMVIQ